MRKKLTALILILGCCVTAFAETFVVTSNADSGAGTLREAIQKAAANGISETDYIHFNITDQSREGRTITLTSELPALTSRLIIDASTQRGMAIGKSDAKVILYRPDNVKNFNFLHFQNCSNIEIYGLFFFGSYFNFGGISWENNNKGISFRNSENITIGKNGKGNYFRGIQYGIFSGIDPRTESKDINSSNVLIQGNLFSLDEEGKPTLNYNVFYNVNPMAYAIYFINVSNITIGGTKEEGNTLSADIFINSFLADKSGFVKIWGNVMGVEKDPPSVFTYNHSYGKTRLTIQGGHDNDNENHADFDVSIRNNILHGSIKLMKLSKYFTVQGNKMFLGNSAIDFTTRMVVSLCTAGGLIGGELEDERNEIFTLAANTYNWSWSTGDLGSINVYGSPKVAIVKNIMRCNQFYGSSIRNNATTSYVRIDKTETNFVSGMATPNSRIEIFLDDDCWACDGKALLGEVVANADSSWSFTGNFTGVVIATATGVDNSTSEYSAPTYNSSKMVVQNPTCNESNGSVRGIQLTGSWTDVEWHTTFMRDGVFVDSIVSRDVDLINVPAGRYYFVSKLGETCRSSTIVVTLKDKTPKINSNYASLTHPSCGLYNGSIYGVQIVDGESSAYYWIDEARSPVKKSANTWGYSIDKLPPGNFKLIVIDTIAGCGDSTDFFTLINQSGPSLNNDKIAITAATCDGANGSIKNITAANVTGTPSIRWVDSLNKVVGTTFDLENVPAGKYRLKFKDQSSCDTIITPYYTIENKGALTLNTDAIRVTPSNCPSPTGTITGIQVTGAESYTWYEGAGNIVSQTFNPGLLFPGQYRLTVTNSFGCQKQTDPIEVGIQPHNNQGLPFQLERKIPRCDSANGYMKVVNFPNEAQYTFRWVDSAQQNVNLSTSTELKDFPAGLYFLYAKDQRGCEQRYVYAKYQPMPVPKINENGRRISNDVCDEKRGAVIGLQASGGTAPLQYTWSDEHNHAVGNALDLQSVGKGKYTLTVQDRMGCKAVSTTFNIQNETRNLRTPDYADQTILRGTGTTLTPETVRQGNYLLFESATATTPVQQNQTGIFETGVLTADKTYYVKEVLGSCESPVKAVHIKVVDETKVFVPTAFTPNNDGKNDVLLPKASGIFHLETFTIYDRWGGLVFQSSSMSKGWDGKNKSNSMPDGVYVWIIKGKDIKGNPIFQKGTTMLMR